MNAPAIQTVQVELPDLTPVCETSHSGERPRADVWIDCHGCAQKFWCRRCLAYIRHRYDAGVLEGNLLHCEVCGRDFETFDDCVTVVGLR